MHFGLGRAPLASEIEIHWPNGLLQRFDNIAGDQAVTIREGSSDMQGTALAGRYTHTMRQ